MADRLDFIQFSNLVLEDVKPEWWSSIYKITYGFAQSLFLCVEEFISKNGGNQEHLARKAFTVFDPDLHIGKKLWNVKRKIFNALDNNKGKESDVCSFLYVKSSCSSSTVAVCSSSEFPGEFCARHNISLEILCEIDNNDDISKCDITRVIIENGLVLELNKVRSKGNYSWKSFTKWLYALSLSNSRPECVWNETSINSCVSRLAIQRQKLSQNKKIDAIDELLRGEFKFPKLCLGNDSEFVELEKEQLGLEAELVQSAADVETLVKIVEAADDEVAYLAKLVEDGIKERRADVLEIRNLKAQIKRMKREQNKTAKKLEEALDKLGHLSVRNVNKRIRSRDTKIENEIEEKKKLEKEYEESLAEKDAEIERLSGLLYKGNISKTKALRMKSYYKRKSETAACSNDGEGVAFRSKIRELNDVITELQNEKLVLEERIEEFLKKKEVKEFQKGKYSWAVRNVYEDLLCMGVSAANCEKVVRGVLEELGGVTVGRLPKESFARTMYLEARRLAQMQVMEELVDNWEEESRTVLSDGTSKFHHKYTAYQVRKDDGQTLVLGMREVSSGDAETQLNVMKEVLKEVVSTTGSEPEEQIKTSNKIVASIKNMMSDRCGVQKKFNELLGEYRKEVVPQITAGWSELSKDEQAKLLKMNDFFCGLHLLVALADQAEAALKVWDRFIHEEKEVGSLKKGCGGFKNGDSGTYRLIRTVCKAIQERGCEKSGRPVQFAHFVESRGQSQGVPLVPFKGNRFNVLFHNGGGVFYLYEDLKIFFGQVKEANNLLKAVHHDLEVVSFVAGCRALGLIDKLVTTPLWKILQDPDVHVLDMSDHYDRLLECFSTWAEDASGFMKGTVALFPGVNVRKGPVFQKLVSESSFWDEMTQQVLEMIFGALEAKMTDMLADHLEGGKYSKAEADVNLKSQTVSVPKTNIEPEEVFGIVDSIMKQKPNAHAFVIESLVLQKKNKLRVWRNQLNPERLAVLRQQALHGAREDQKLKVLKKMELRQAIEEKRLQSLEQKEAKARKERAEKAELMDKIEEMGGLWKSEEEVSTSVEQLSSDKERREALKCQIMFRKKVLGSTYPDKKVFQMSAGGKLFTIQELKSNLCLIINRIEEERQDDQMNENVEDWKLPKVLTADQLDQQKKKWKEMASKAKERNLKRKGEEVAREAKKRRSAVVDEGVPVVSLPDDLVGKRVEHLVKHDEESEEEWWKGIVGTKLTRGRNPKYYIYYDGFDEEYECRFNEFKKGEIRALPISGEDLVGKKVEILMDNDEGNEMWTLCSVIGVNEKVDRNSEFFVEIQSHRVESDDESDNDEDYYDIEQDLFSFPLIDYYLNNFLRLLAN